MSILRLLDVSGIFWPIWRIKEAKGEPIGRAAEETVRTLRERCAYSDADYVVACCDAGRSFRWQIAEEYRPMLPNFPGYKGHRPAKDPAMMAALDRVIEELEADGVPVFKVAGFEADDVIATLARWAVENGLDVEAVTEDKDLRQLVRDPDPNNEHRPAVRVVLRNGDIVNEAAVLARFGVPPSHLAAWLAMAGDSSDGVVGIAGIGEETAAALLWGFTKDGEWHPSPFRSYGDMVTAAAADQAQVEANDRELASARENKAVRQQAKLGLAADQIAEKLGITIDAVIAHLANPVDRLPQFPKPRFKDSTRKALLAGDRMFDISLRLTQLRDDVPLDFSTVTAPRVPKTKPHAPEWGEQRSRAANINAAVEAADNEEQEETMLDESHEPLPRIPTIIDAPVVAPPPVVVAASAPAVTPSVAPPAAPVQTTALALSKPATAGPKRTFELELEPRSYDAAMLVAEHAADSRLFKDITTPPQAMMLIMLGRKFGLSALDALRMIHMIEGKPSMSAQLIVGIIQKSGFAEYFEIESLDETQATWVTMRKGARREQRWTFSINDAKKALLGGIWDKDKKAPRDTFDPNSNWAKHGKVMCMWRAAVFLARAVYADLVGGLYTPDELGGDEGEIDGNPPMYGTLGQAA